MKIALIYPEYYDVAHFGEKRKEIPPFGVLYIASIIEQCKIEVTVIRVSNENFKLDLRNYDIVGFSFSSSVTYNLIKNTRLNSRFSENVLIIAGGIHATFYPEAIIDECKIEVVCLGEGEQTILEIIKEYQTREFDKIKGIVYTKERNIIKTQTKELVKDIDSLPFPARHLLHKGDIVMKDRLAETDLLVAHIMISRGCVGKCYFCANTVTKIRYRSGDNVKKELLDLIDKYKIQGFCVVDDNFAINKKRVISICKEIKSLNLKWSSLSRVDTVDIDLLKVMKESGCLEIKFGIESGSQRILDAMNKKITVGQIKQAIDLTYDAGINIKAFLLHGFPGENIESTKETITLLEQLKDKIKRISLFRFVPLPGSHVYKHFEDFKLVLPANFDEIFIYNNEKLWWGNEEDKRELSDSYLLLETFIKQNWGKY